MGCSHGCLRLNGEMFRSGYVRSGHGLAARPCPRRFSALPLEPFLRSPLCTAALSSATVRERSSVRGEAPEPVKVPGLLAEPPTCPRQCQEAGVLWRRPVAGAPDDGHAAAATSTMFRTTARRFCVFTCHPAGSADGVTTAVELLRDSGVAVGQLMRGWPAWVKKVLRPVDLHTHPVTGPGDLGCDVQSLTTPDVTSGARGPLPGRGEPPDADRGRPAI